MDQVRQVVHLVESTLDVVGAYLHGSAVLGGLRPASDLDILVVTDRRMAGSRRRALWDGLLALSGGPGRRPVELIVVARSDVCPWRYPPTADFLYGEWLRHNRESAPEPMPDLALLLTTVLDHGLRLSGSPARDVLDPVPAEDVVRACRAGVPTLLDDLQHDTRNVVLTFARIWYTLSTGAIVAKHTAADWALSRLPHEHRAVLAHARALYLDSSYAEETWDEDVRAAALPCVRHILTEISERDHVA